MTISELLVAATVTTAVMAGVLEALGSAQRVFLSQSEAADVSQRLRVGVETLTRELRAATLVLPYGPSGPADDAITIQQGAVRHVYYLAADPATGTWQLRHHDGDASDLPVLDGLAALAVEYAGESGVIPSPALRDGPWLPDAAHPDRFDADLLRVRLVRIRIRASGRDVTDAEVVFDVAPRNMDAAS